MNPMKPATMQAAVEAYRKSVRFHAVCNSIVSEVMALASGALDDVERWDAWRARGRATRCPRCCRRVRTIGENDAEIAQWKALAERVTDAYAETMRLSLPLEIMPASVRVDEIARRK